MNAKKISQRYIRYTKKFSDADALNSKENRFAGGRRELGCGETTRARDLCTPLQLVQTTYQSVLNSLYSSSVKRSLRPFVHQSITPKQFQSHS